MEWNRDAGPVTERGEGDFESEIWTTVIIVQEG